jgi:hypothetical protein
MDIWSLTKKVLDISIRRAAFALALGKFTAFSVFLGATVAQGQPLNQITSCVEVPSALVAASRRRASSRSDCDPQTAFDKAQQQSQANSRNALASVCRNEISAAEAEEVCSAASGSIPTTGTSLSADPFSRAGGPQVDSQLPIAQSDPKLCVVLRDLPDETQTSTQPAGIGNGFCLFNNGRVTTKTVRSRARCGVQCSTVKQHQFQVRRFTTAILTNADADEILADATTVLKTDEGARDVACSVTLSRVGDVTEFTQGDGSIDTEAELSNLFALPGHIKVVNAINFCNGFTPDTIGCASTPGTSFVVERFTANQEGILWAHEFGHNKGLDHRDNDPNAVMNGTIEVSRRRVTSAECGAYQSLDEAAVASASAAVPAPASDAPSLDALPTDVRQFVRQTFIHGVPYEQATKYSPDVVPTLVEMLKDRAEEPYWSNILVVLGIIGEKRGIDEMILFVERDRGKISAAHYRAKTSAIMSLGYALNKTGSRKELDYLTSGIDPKVWSTRAGSNLAPYQKTTDERDHDFAKYAIMGLALSGHPDAARALRSLQQPVENEAQRKFRDQVSDLVAEALKEHQKVASRGLVDYYRSK